MFHLFLCFDSHGPRDAGGPRPRYTGVVITLILIQVINFSGVRPRQEGVNSSTIKHGFVPGKHCRRGLSAAQHRAQAAPRPPIELAVGPLRVPEQRVARARRDHQSAPLPHGRKTARRRVLVTW